MSQQIEVAQRRSLCKMLLDGYGWVAAEKLCRRNSSFLGGFLKPTLFGFRQADLQNF